MWFNDGVWTWQIIIPFARILNVKRAKRHLCTSSQEKSLPSFIESASTKKAASPSDSCPGQRGSSDQPRLRRAIPLIQDVVCPRPRSLVCCGSVPPFQVPAHQSRCPTLGPLWGIRQQLAVGQGCGTVDHLGGRSSRHFARQLVESLLQLCYHSVIPRVLSETLSWAEASFDQSEFSLEQQSSREKIYSLGAITGMGGGGHRESVHDITDIRLFPKSFALADIETTVT